MWFFRKPKIEIIQKKLPEEKEWRSLHGLADGARPEMIAAFLKAVAKTQNAFVLKRVERALESGDTKQAIDTIPWDTFAAELNVVTAIFHDIYNKSGTNAVKYLPKKIETTVSFNTTNPKSLEFIGKYTGDMITQITEETKLGVRAVIDRSFRQGAPPRESAKYIKNLVGLTEKQSIAVDNLRTSLLEQEVHPKIIDKNVNQYADRLLNYRADMISRTETLRAANEGTMGLWDQLVEQGVIDSQTAQKKFIVTPDDKLCDFCADYDGVTVGLDEEFDDGDPPLHPNCRCCVGLVTE